MLTGMHGGIERYILDADGNPVPEPDLLKWGRWMEEGGRQLAVDEVGDMLVSTVFLGIDHSFRPGGPPVLWETMIFAADGDSLDQRRYTNRDDALRGHAQLVADAFTIRARSPGSGPPGQDRPGQDPGDPHRQPERDDPPG